MASLTLPQTPVFWAQNCTRQGRRVAVCSPVATPSTRVVTDLQTCELQCQGWHASSRRGLVIMATQAGAGGPKKPPMKKKVKKLVDINGDVTKDLGNGMFQIKLDNGVSVMAYLSGKIQQNRIKIVMGDKVTVELSPYDLTKGRITYRFRPEEVAAMAAEKRAAA